MATVPILLQRLKELDAATSTEPQFEATEQLDRFTLIRIKLAGLIKEIRKVYRCRTGLILQNTQERAPSEQIRPKLKEAYSLGRELEKIHKKDSHLEENEQKNREKALKMMHMHFQYLEGKLSGSSSSSSSRKPFSSNDLSNVGDAERRDHGFRLSTNLTRQSVLIELDAKEFASVLANEEKIVSLTEAILTISGQRS
jgi:hypothetical protein